MKTTAILASFTIIGSFAFATSQRGSNSVPTSMPQAPAQEPEAERTPPSTPRSSSLLAACNDETWFDLTPRPFLNDCSGNPNPPACLPLGISDVNGDGIPDLFSAQGGIIYESDDVTPDFVALVHQGVNLSVSGVSASQTAVFHSAPIAAWVKPMVPGRNWEYPGQETWHCGGEVWICDLQLNGWLDCDGDGNLDLVATVNIWREVKCQNCGCWNCGCSFTRYFSSGNPEGIWKNMPVWFKNTGFTSRVRSDINGDGRVDGSDLGAVLSNWGPTQ